MSVANELATVNLHGPNVAERLEREAGVRSEEREEEIHRARMHRIARHPAARTVGVILDSLHTLEDSLRDLLRSHGPKCRCRFCAHVRAENDFNSDWWKDLGCLAHTLQVFGSIIETNAPHFATDPDE